MAPDHQTAMTCASVLGPTRIDQPKGAWQMTVAGVPMNKWSSSSGTR
jgi:hypothetical protein